MRAGHDYQYNRVSRGHASNPVNDAQPLKRPASLGLIDNLT